MRDIPVFATGYGVGSLLLKEIPYKEIAYIRIHDATEPEKFMNECVGFCRAAGAEHIYASGHNCLESRPQYTSIVEMERSLENLPATDACVVSITPQTAQQWREIYNQRMTHVPNAASMSHADMEALLGRGAGYFVYRDKVLLGIGIAAQMRLEALAAVEPGAGKDVLLALCGVLQADAVRLEVASTNFRAIHLYESMGFVITEEKTRWYKIL